MNPLHIGRVIAVHGFQVKVELDADHRSAVRASMDGVDTHVRINAYVTFDLGAGDAVLGIITDLDAHETFEPGSEDLTLELVRPRRIATAQLLGTVRTASEGRYEFDPGVNLLPTLETPAIPARPDVLKTVLEDSPQRNKPEEWTSSEPFDTRLPIGQATAARDRCVYASFNDIFSRPIAIVGNTGSGKSCTIAHLIQTAIRLTTQLKESPQGRPHFFVIDINGEYSRAFGVEGSEERQPNRLYVNGEEATLPVWLMNAHEACQWLSASEQTQQPALVNLWALAKGATSSTEKGHNDVRSALLHCQTIVATLDSPTGFYKGQSIAESWDALKSFADLSSFASECSVIEAIVKPSRTDKNVRSKSLGAEEKQFRDALRTIQIQLEGILGSATFTVEQTADKPVYFPVATLDNPAHLDAAAELSPGDKAIKQFLVGLQLRLHNRRNDRRWHCFYNFDSIGVKSLRAWLLQLGVGADKQQAVTVIDCSMLAHDVLPFACAILGRVLLEIREQADSSSRFDDPWVIVLEEAHNYVRPIRTAETHGEMLSRDTFERIAKEGRKFGLSLMVASQRPSDISATVLSQCSNFITHRLQNPDDIDHFRRIVPSQSRRLIDQITILRAGEAVVVGSAFNVPSRVQVKRPYPEPASASSTPFIGWRIGSDAFDLEAALKVWDVEPEAKTGESEPF